MSHSNGTNYLHIIYAPNQPGVTCDFQQHDTEMPTYNGFYLPNFPNFRLYDVPGSACDTLGIIGVNQPFTTSKPGIRLSPDSAAEMVEIRFDEPPGRSRIRVFNLLGQLVNQEDIAEGYTSVNMSVSGWPSGTYINQVEQPTKGRWLGKLVVAHTGE